MNFDVPEVKNLEFVEDGHLYLYNVGGKETTKKRIPLSVTGIVRECFPYNKEANALRIVDDFLVMDKMPYDKEVRRAFEQFVFPPKTSTEARRDALKKKVLAIWGSSADFGTDVHSHLEKYIRDGTKPTLEKCSGRERTAFDAGVKFLDEEKLAGFEPIKTELKICAPFLRTRFHKIDHDSTTEVHEQKCCGLAGGIDLILYNKETKKCKVCDWKTCKKSTGIYIEKHREEWKLQLGCYHMMLTQSILPVGSYDAVSFEIFQIHPDYSEKHVFGVTETEIAVNKAFHDNVFWPRDLEKKDTPCSDTRIPTPMLAMKMHHAECIGRDDE